MSGVYAVKVWHICIYAATITINYNKNVGMRFETIHYTAGEQLGTKTFQLVHSFTLHGSR
jgi:hypothetical protein